MTHLDLDDGNDWRLLLSHLPRDWARLADQHGQIETRFGHAKITTADALLRLLLLHVGHGLPLRETVEAVERAGGPAVSPMRVHKKMCRAAPYLHALVSRMIDFGSEARAERWSGYDLVIAACDAGTSDGARAVNVHTKTRVADVRALDVRVGDAGEGESFRRFLWSEGELAFGSSAYATPESLAWTVRQRADALVEIDEGSLALFAREDVPLDASLVTASLRAESVLDLPAFFEHDGARVEGRFLATRPTAADARCTLLFTTVPRDRASATRCLQAHRLVERAGLELSRWRSLAGFDRVVHVRPQTIEAWLYAKLLLGAVLDRMSAQRVSLRHRRVRTFQSATAGAAQRLAASS